MYDIEKEATSVYGLKYFPKLLPPLTNEDDYPSTCQRVRVTREFSDENQARLLEYFLKVKDVCKCIVEIGVHRNTYEQSSTSVFLNNKLDSTIYIGVDTSNKSFLDNPAKNVYTIECSSSHYHKIYNKMAELAVKDIDFLFIDGWHSVNQVYKDWHYVSRVSKYGIIGMHDTNYHPGPVEILAAVDTDIFRIDKYCEVDNDWGISFIRKKND
jgi:hypothetical protein